jgi:lipopolysaccharide exporter
LIASTGAIVRQPNKGFPMVKAGINILTAHADRHLGADGATFLRALSVLGGAEVAIRVVRILAVIVIARVISPTAMGAAALALTLFELVRVLANVGIGQQIIVAAEDQLSATCNTARRLLTLWCVAVSMVQLGVALVVWLAFDLGEVAAMLTLLAPVYWMMPAGLVQVFLTMRAGEMSKIARITLFQNSADHALTLLLVVLFPSPWSIVAPKLLTTPIWLYMARRTTAWQADTAAGTVAARGFLHLSAGILGSELLTAARGQFDKLIIAALLGIGALGTYFFAYGAGLGITLSFVTAFGTVVFSKIGPMQSAPDQARAFRHYTKIGMALFLPVTIAQCVLAPIYVPIIFGAMWADSAILVSILSLGAIPMLLGAAVSGWLRARNQGSVEVAMMALATLGSLSGLAIGAMHSVEAAAGGYVGGLTLTMIPFAFLILSRDTALNTRPLQTTDQD